MSDVQPCHTCGQVGCSKDSECEERGPRVIEYAEDMTKRELFAAMAMQGLASYHLGPEVAASGAIHYADALIAALAASEEGE